MWIWATLFLQLTTNSAHATHEPSKRQLVKLARTCNQREKNSADWIIVKVKPFEKGRRLESGDHRGDPIESILDPQIWVVVCDVEGASQITISRPETEEGYSPISYLRYQVPKLNAVLLHIYSDEPGVWPVGFSHEGKDESVTQNFSFITTLPPTIRPPTPPDVIANNDSFGKTNDGNNLNSGGNNGPYNYAAPMWAPFRRLGDKLLSPNLPATN